MIKMRRKVAFILAVALLMVLAYAFPVLNAGSEVYAADSGTATQFINDARWKNGVSWGARRPKLSGWDSSGCCAYAADFAKYCYGANSPSSGVWFGNPSEIRGGDIIEINGHWFCVISRTKNALYTCEGNMSGKVRVASDVYTISGNSINDKFNGTRKMLNGYHYTSGGNDPWYKGYGYLNIGTDFYAQLILRSTWVAPSINPSTWNVENGEKVTGDYIHNVSYKSQYWHFVRNSDGSYQLLNTYYNNRPLEAVGTTSGTNVKLGSSYTGAAKQKWYFYDLGGNGNGHYIVKNAASDFVLNVDSEKSAPGTNLQIWKYTNSGAEQFNVYKHTPTGAATLSVTAANESANTQFSWPQPSGEVKWYDLMVSKIGTSGTAESTYNRTYLTDKSASLSLPAGEYNAYLVSHSYFNEVKGNSVSFTVGSSDAEKPKISNIRIVNNEASGSTIEADVSDNDGLDKSRSGSSVYFLLGDRKVLGPFERTNIEWLSDTKIKLTVKPTTCERIEVRFSVYDKAGNQSEDAFIVLDRPASTYVHVTEGETFKISDFSYFSNIESLKGWTDYSYYGDYVTRTDDTFTAIAPGKSTLYFLNKTTGEICGIVIVVDPKECTHENTVRDGYKAANCTEKGYTGNVVCTECGKIVERGKTIPETVHNYGDGTPLDSEEHVIRCVRCDDEITEGHHFGSSKVNTQAGFGKDGETETVCRDCGYIRTSFISAIGTVKLSKTSYIYNGKVQRPAVTVRDVDGVAINSDMYEVVYPSGCKNIGSYNVRVVFRGSYTGIKTLTYKIEPKRIKLSGVSALKRGFKAKWKKGSGITGYEIQYGLKSSFKGAKTARITKEGTVSKKITKLKAKKRYYVRLRAYKTVNGKKYYSAWSKAKNVKTK